MHDKSQNYELDIEWALKKAKNMVNVVISMEKLEDYAERVAIKWQDNRNESVSRAQSFDEVFLCKK